jgi:hypothetical protein
MLSCTSGILVVSKPPFFSLYSSLCSVRHLSSISSSVSPLAGCCVWFAVDIVHIVSHDNNKCFISVGTVCVKAAMRVRFTVGNTQLFDLTFTRCET